MKRKVFIWPSLRGRMDENELFWSSCAILFVFSLINVTQNNVILPETRCLRFSRWCNKLLSLSLSRSKVESAVTFVLSFSQSYEKPSYLILKGIKEDSTKVNPFVVEHIVRSMVNGIRCWLHRVFSFCSSLTMKSNAYTYECCTIFEMGISFNAVNIQLPAMGHQICIFCQDTDEITKCRLWTKSVLRKNLLRCFMK